MNTKILESLAIKGELTDEIIRQDGSVEKIEQGHNMIVNGCHTLIARFIAGELTDRPYHIFYFQSGTDKTAANAADTKLINSIVSKKCTMERDGNIIRLTATFDENDGNNQEWWECGILMLLGHEQADGESIEGKTVDVVDGKTIVIDEELLLNRKVTNYPIVKDESFSLKRTFKFTF